jgi:predicted HD phosphohydrolase
MMANTPYHNRHNQHTLITAALLHDYGHIAYGQPIAPETGIDDKHEIIGADALSNLGFPQSITEPIRLHVQAKRYLCTVDSKYPLSEGSKLSLQLQGGLMSKTELVEFQNNLFFEHALLLRYADDSGKDDMFCESEANILTFEKIIQMSLY